MKPNLVSFSEASKYIYHSKTLLVDLRSREAFATSHISGAWNIPYEELSQYQEEMMNYDRIIFTATMEIIVCRRRENWQKKENGRPVSPEDTKK